MELLQLRYFYESSKNESFAKTAEKYMVPPTSVSASVKRLENELGCPLFNRSSNRISLNDNGRILRHSLDTIFSELDNAIEKITSASTDMREIKILVRAMRGEITDRIIEYKTMHPHISFKTVFDFDKTDFENYDIIIDEKRDLYSNFEHFKLFTTRIRLRASVTNPLCGKKLTLKQLKNQPFISIGENNGLHRILIEACKRAGFTPDIVVQTNDLGCIKKCVQANVGIGLGREYSHSKPLENMAYLDITDFNEIQTIFAHYKAQSAYGNVKHFLNFLKKRCI